MLNPMPLLERLDTLTDVQKTHMYMKLFNSPEGELVIVDLMDRFFEFKPTSNPQEAGSQAVIIYIKNRLLGIAEEPSPQPEGEE